MATRHTLLNVIAGVCLMTLASSNQIGTSEDLVFKTYGIKINVTDLETATTFYCTKLGFEIESRTDNQIFLKTGQKNKLILNKVRLLAPTSEQDSRAVLTLQINNIDSTIERLRTHDISISPNEIRREAVGNAFFLKDPFGNTISLMHQTIVAVPHFAEPKIYNFGFLIPDIDKARSFYCDNFKFVVRTEKYLPLDLPLDHPDKAFAFMLHFRENVRPIRFNTSDNERNVILFQTNNLDLAISRLKANGIRFQQRKPVESAMGRYISFYDPFGYLSELVEAGD